DPHGTMKPGTARWGKSFVPWQWQPNRQTAGSAVARGEAKGPREANQRAEREELSGGRGRGAVLLYQAPPVHRVHGRHPERPAVLAQVRPSGDVRRGRDDLRLRRRAEPALLGGVRPGADQRPFLDRERAGDGLVGPGRAVRRVLPLWPAAAQRAGGGGEGVASGPFRGRGAVAS